MDYIAIENRINGQVSRKVFQFPTIGSLSLPRNYKLCVRMHRMDRPGGTWRNATMPRFEHRNGLLLLLLLDGIPFLFSSSSSKIELPRHLDAQIAWYNAGILPFPMPDISTWSKRIDPRILDRDTELEPVASIYIPKILKNLFRVTSVSSISRTVVRITYINKNLLSKCIKYNCFDVTMYNNYNDKILNPLFYRLNEYIEN